MRKWYGSPKGQDDLSLSLTKRPIDETSISVHPVSNCHSGNQIDGQSHILVSKTTSHFFQR
jgi:hypothetical protein